MSEADPFAPADPIVALPAAERVNYATGVMLAADDFLDEQSYHRARLATALKSVAGFGTLAGLRVRAPAATDPERELVVDAGVAIDRYGRLIELDGPWCIRLSRWFFDQQDGDLIAGVQAGPSVLFVDVFLSALDCATAKTPAFATGPFDALDALVPARIAETAALTLVIRDEAGTPPLPKNYWPDAATATPAEKLEAVLGSWNAGYSTDSDAVLDALEEHVLGQDPSAIFLARVTVPVTVPASPPGAPPSLAPDPVTVDNSGRPIIFLPGKWLGTAPLADPS